MKKALLVLLAVVAVGAIAYAQEPTFGFAINEFTGSASASLVVDLDNSAIAFSNAVSTSLKFNLVSGNNKKATTGEGIWAELILDTSDDPLIVSGSTVTGLTVTVDTAKIHFGENVYLDIKAPGSTIDYIILPDEAAPYAQYSAKYATTAGSGLVSDSAGAAGPSTVASGATLDITLPKLAEFALSFGSPTWVDLNAAPVVATSELPPLTKNNFAAVAKVALLAVDNLTLEAKVATGLGGDSQKYDLGLGAKAGYKLMLGEKMFVKPAVTMNYETPGGQTKSYMVLAAGALFGFGGAKTDAIGKTYFFSGNGSTDWGYYPGVSVSLINYGDATGTGLVGVPSKVTALNVSAFTNADFVPGLKAALAYEIDNLAPATGVTQKSGLSAVVTYALTAGNLTITPKFGVNTYGDSLVSANNTMFAKAGVDVGGLLNNTTVSAQWDSNDLTNGYLNTQTAKKDKIGKFTVTCKVSF